MSRFVKEFIFPPCRRGSTKVSNPTLVNTPGRPAAASRCMWNRMPLGRLKASIWSSSIIFQIFGVGSEVGPLGREPEMTHLGSSGYGWWLLAGQVLVLDRDTSTGLG